MTRFRLIGATVAMLVAAMISVPASAAGTPPATPASEELSAGSVDRALRADELGERMTAPAQDEEFVISHADNVAATGFVEHLKLPHYVDFQAELGLVRRLREGVAQ